MAEYTGSDYAASISLQSSQYAGSLNPQIPVPIKYTGTENGQPNQPQLAGAPCLEIGNESFQSPSPQIEIPISSFSGSTSAAINRQPDQPQLSGKSSLQESDASTQPKSPEIAIPTSTLSTGATTSQSGGVSGLKAHGSIIPSLPSSVGPDPHIIVPLSLKGTLDLQPAYQTWLSGQFPWPKSQSSAQSPNPLIPIPACQKGTLPTQPDLESQLSGKESFLRSKASTAAPNPQIHVPIRYPATIQGQPADPWLWGKYELLKSKASTQIPVAGITIPMCLTGTLDRQPARMYLIGQSRFTSGNTAIQTLNPIMGGSRIPGYTALQPVGQPWLNGRLFRFLSSQGWDVYARYDEMITLVKSTPSQLQYDISILLVNSIQFDESITLVISCSHDETITLVKSIPGQLQYDNSIFLANSIQYDESITLVKSLSYDDSISLYLTKAYDERIYLWKSSEQPITDCVSTESPALTGTRGNILIKHPALKQIKLYATDGTLLDISTYLTDLSKGRIVTAEVRKLNTNKKLDYIEVTTADNKVHKINV